MSEEEIFHKALSRSPKERAAYLDEACCGNSALRASVEALLRANVGATGFLENAAAATVAPISEQTLREFTETVIGPYKLLHQIGEGGMGAVFMAEQQHPVRRKVALKVIKAGMDTRQVIARFEAERQALALMDHPNIARVFDAGTTDSGLPYFVMELVHGVPITKYCDDNLLSPRERLELFVPVCQAIQHAHQKGIIHRDIKPSNVMVTLYDGRPIPKVIDFGVAKATEQNLTERTLFTQYGTLVGTLEYMSPEQAELSDQGIDTRSDIYSLGVLLYELLTGTTPLTRQRLKEAGFAEILRVIKEEEPVKPSSRLTDSGAALASISAQRKTEPAKLTRLVRGDLDWIVMKSLEKERNRRYETANGFAADVLRYLNDEPVQASPPSTWYRARKFVRRNKRAVAVASTLMGMALSSLILTVVLLANHAASLQEAQERTDKEYQRAETALEDATRNLKRADQNLGLALEALDDLCMKDVENRINRDRRLTKAERESLQRGLAFYERFAEQNSGHAELQEVMAKAYRRAGVLRLEMKDLKEASDNFTKAIPVFEKRADDSVGSEVVRHDLARCCYGLSLSLAKMGRYPEAEPSCRRAVGLLEKLAAQFPHIANYRVELGHSLWLLSSRSRFSEAGILFATRRPKEAEDTSRAALAVFEGLVAEHPKDRFYRQETAFSLRQLSQIFADTGRPEQAIAGQRQAIDIYAALVAEVPRSTYYRGELAFAYSGLGNILRANQRFAETEEAYRRAVAVLAPLAAETKEGYHRHELAWYWQSLGVLRRQAGRLDEAAEFLRSALAVRTKLVSEFADVKHRRGLADTRRTLLAVLSDRAKEVAQDTQLGPAERQAVAQKYREEARTLVREGIADKSIDVSLSDLADYPELEDLLITSLLQEVQRPGADALTLSFRMHQVAVQCLQSGKYAQAETLFRACLPIRDRQQPSSWTTFNTRVRLGATLLAQQKYAEAEPFLLEGYEGLKQREAQIPVPEKKALADAIRWLIELYEAQGRTDKAEPWRQDLLPDLDGWFAWCERLQAMHKWERALLAYQDAAKGVADAGRQKRLRLASGFYWVARGLQDQRKFADCIAAHRKAALLLEQILAEQPAADDVSSVKNDLASVYAYLGWAHEGRKQIDDAVAAESKAVSLWNGLRQADPEREWYAREEAFFSTGLAVLLGSMNRAPDALAYARAGAELHEQLFAKLPDSQLYRDRLGGSREVLLNLLWSSGRTDEASAAARHAREVNPGNAALLRSLVRAESKAGRWSEAVADLSKVVDLSPDSAVDHNNLGWYLATCPDAKVRDPQRALALAKRAVELAPKEGNNWNTLGVVQHYAGDKRAALSALYKSMELRRGGDSFDWFFLAMAHWQQGDKETARRWYVLANRWMAKYKPDDNELRRFRAEASTLLGMSEKIDSVPQIQPDEVELYTLITLRDPAAAWAYRERGRIHGGLCQWDAALSDYEKAHDLAPDDLPALAYPLGLLHLRAQQKDKYRQLCADLLARVGNRGNPNSAILIGILCKQAPEALADLSLPLKLVAQALAQRPTDRLGHGIHAHLLYRAGQHAESAKQLDELIRTDDVKSIHQPFNKLFLAKAQQRLGRLAEARKTLDEAIAWIDEHGQARLADGIILNEPQHWALRLEIQLLRQETEAVVGRTKSKD